MRNGRSLLCPEWWSRKPSPKWSLSWILQNDSDLAIQRVQAERPKWKRSHLGKAVNWNWEGLSQLGHSEPGRAAWVELSREAKPRSCGNV